MKKILGQYLQIALGAFLISLAVVVFFVPSKISSGGISTIGTVLFYIFGIPLSVTNIVINAFLFIFGYRFLGKNALIHTVYGIIVLTVFLEICTYIPAYIEDKLISVALGGTTLGFGIGLVIRNSGSTGGTDFLSVMIHKKYPHLSVANIIFFVDIVIICFSGIVLGGITVTVYSAIALYISSSICDTVISYGNATKVITVISLDYMSISEKIQNYHNRGVTGIKCCGMYRRDDILMLYCVVSPREVPSILDTVRNTDKNAFVVISDSREVHGRGFLFEYE